MEYSEKCRIVVVIILLVARRSLSTSLHSDNNDNNTESGLCGAKPEVCSYWEFRCLSGSCINMRKFCDGFRDCPDGSDERPADNSNASAAGVACNSLLNHENRTCLLPQLYVCDGMQQCHGFADEEEQACQFETPYRKQCDGLSGKCLNGKVLNCPNYSHVIKCYGDFCTYKGNDPNEDCASFIFRCDSGECLRADQFCDGVKHCKDGSDEKTEPEPGKGIMCSGKWNPSQKQCFLPKEYLCDGIDHCKNRTDECDNCEHSFQCDNGNCIPKRAPSYWGDGRDDCGDSSDECSMEYFDDQEKVFTCMNGQCLAYEKFCDGRVDCEDGSDEIQPGDPAWNVTAHSVACQNSATALNLTCVLPSVHLCDGSLHCKDHSDEWECANSLDYFRCANKRLVPSGMAVCNFRDDCLDSSDECLPGCNKTFTCLHTKKCIAFSRFCDGVDDCGDGSDEMLAENEYGSILCNNENNTCDRQCVLPHTYLCDGMAHCVNRVDECESDCRESFFCDDGQCLPRTEFCNGRAACRDGSDEKNYGPGFKCPVSSADDKEAHICVLPQRMTNDSVADCVGNVDSCYGNNTDCIRCLNGDMYIAESQVCDGIFDCPDLSDECVCDSTSLGGRMPLLCSSLCLESDPTCSLCPKGMVPCGADDICVKLSQVCDTKVDCKNGADEAACASYNQRKDQQTHPKNFSCPMAPDELAVECDGIPECYSLADECALVSESETISPLQVKDATPTGGQSNSSEFKCGEKTSKICTALTKNSLGFYQCPEKKRIILPEKICDGEEYCFPPTTSAPSSVIRSWSDFSADERYCPKRWLCHQSRPLEAGKVSIHVSRLCDGRIDCEGEEDEARELCASRDPSRFYCEERMRKSSGFVTSTSRDPLFVPRRLVFDGKIDCWDGSDECPTKWFTDNAVSSRYDMIKDKFLRVLVWLMAIVALAGNFIVVWHTMFRLLKVRRLSPMMRSNLVLVLNLAFADFLMGIYLLALAIQNVMTSGRYCHVDREWRASFECASLGTLAMISIQSSVMFLIILTSYRVIAVLRPFRADTMHVRYTVVLVGVAWALAICMAILPRLHGLEDYFTSAAWIVPSVDYFPTDTPNKTAMQVFAGRLRTLSQDGILWHGYVFPHAKHSVNTWAGINQTLHDFYPDYWTTFRIQGYIGYYSANSVCLPKLFVTTKDSAWEYSVGIMTFDLASFLFVMTSYLVIYHDAARSACVNRKDEENKIMQGRITRLVLTDFACWGPVCVISFLSLAGLAIAPVTYAFAAVVMLPINSALNPIIYSNVLNVIYGTCLRPLTASLRKRIRTSRENLSRIRHRTNVSRTSIAVTLSTNDCPPPPEGAILLGRIDQRAE